jgi:hypothetical protein
MLVCSQPDCGKKVSALGLCSCHYMRLRRAGLVPVGTRARGSLVERFWRFVNKSDGCWLWTGGSVNAKGYGQIQEGGKGTPHVLAHRLSYQIHHGDISDGFVVMHKCDTPGCVNPAHLSAGTQSENILDSFRKGRKVCVPPINRGEAHHLSVLTASDVALIRSSDTSIKALAQQLGVSAGTVGRVRRRQTWKHIP